MVSEIRELNLTYLMLARRMLQKDRDMAMLQMQISAEMSDFLLSVPSIKLIKLADVNQFLFSLRFNKTRQLKKLINNERDQGMGQIHTSLLLSSHPFNKASASGTP